MKTKPLSDSQIALIKDLLQTLRLEAKYQEKRVILLEKLIAQELNSR